MATRKKANKKAMGGSIGRSKPMAPRAGMTQTRRRYDKGGKLQSK
jgi:hypothetical protein